MIGCFGAVAAIGLAIASALWKRSFVWVAFVSAISGADILAAGPRYGMVIEENTKGNFSYFLSSGRFARGPCLPQPG